MCNSNRSTRQIFGILHTNSLLTTTDNITSKNTDLSSWIALYIHSELDDMLRPVLSDHLYVCVIFVKTERKISEHSKYETNCIMWIHEEWRHRPCRFFTTVFFLETLRYVTLHYVIPSIWIKLMAQVKSAVSLLSCIVANAARNHKYYIDDRRMWKGDIERRSALKKETNNETFRKMGRWLLAKQTTRHEQYYVSDIRHYQYIR
jgi:hypothetical protein